MTQHVKQDVPATNTGWQPPAKGQIKLNIDATWTKEVVGIEGLLKN